jgi:hypothetical protein
MREGTPNPQINVSKISGGAGMAGALFAVISTVIFLIGIPALRYFLPAAIVLGCAVALVTRFKRHETPGKPWILLSAKKSDNESADGSIKTSVRRALIPIGHFS